MSAFIVDNRTINKIVSWLEFEVNSGQTYGRCAKQLKELGYNLDIKEHAERLAVDMFKLNCNSIEQRYGKGQTKKFGPLDFKYQFEAPVMDIAVLKAIQCWSYQCCEGDISETSKLYKAFETIKNMIAHSIISRLPDYEKSNWG